MSHERGRRSGGRYCGARPSRLGVHLLQAATVEADVSLAWRAVRSLQDSDIVGLHGVLEARLKGACCGPLRGLHVLERSLRGLLQLPAGMFGRLRAFRDRHHTDATLELHVTPAATVAAIQTMGSLATSALTAADVLVVASTELGGDLAEGGSVSPGASTGQYCYL
jgi:hypothetical protein